MFSLHHSFPIGRQIKFLLEAQLYLQDLIDSDLRDNGGNLGIATEGLLWLKRQANTMLRSLSPRIFNDHSFRGLEFMLEMLTLMVDGYRSTPDKSKTENLVSVINTAYERTLKRHHGFMSKQLFKVGRLLSNPFSVRRCRVTEM